MHAMGPLLSRIMHAMGPLLPRDHARDGTFAAAMTYAMAHLHALDGRSNGAIAAVGAFLP
jgi:hypothetical protein